MNTVASLILEGTTREDPDQQSLEMNIAGDHPGNN